MPVSRPSINGLRKNQGLANPVGVTGFDVENPINMPVIAINHKSEQEHADPGVDAGGQMTVLTFLKFVSARLFTMKW